MREDPYDYGHDYDCPFSTRSCGEGRGPVWSASSRAAAAAAALPHVAIRMWEGGVNEPSPTHNIGLRVGIGVCVRARAIVNIHVHVYGSVACVRVRVYERVY